MSTPTYAELLATAKENYAKLLGGAGVVEWWEGGHRVRLSDPDKMLKVIERLEQLAADEADGTRQIVGPLI